MALTIVAGSSPSLGTINANLQLSNGPPLFIFANSFHSLALATKNEYSILAIATIPKGSFLEKFGHVATFVLKSIWNYPTRIIGRIADERSDGIKDLRWGFMVEDWKGEDANKLMNVKKTEVPPLPGLNYHLLLGSMSETVVSEVQS